MFVRRQDNQITIGTGDMSVAVSAGESGPGDMEMKYDGPEVDVVVTKDTQIYVDATELSFEAIQQGATIQQKVKPGSLDEISKNTSVMVWGQRRGDRLIATTVLYNNPMAAQAVGQ